MKNIIASLLVFTASTAAFAGDNGSYIDCVSQSGRTQFLLGNIGELKVDDSGKALDFLQLTIDRKSLGMLEENNSVFKYHLDESTIRFSEAGGEVADIVTVRKINDTKYIILSGLDPRTNTPLTHTIQLTCKTVYNPI